MCRILPVALEDAASQDDGQTVLVLRETFGGASVRESLAAAVSDQRCEVQFKRMTAGKEPVKSGAALAEVQTLLAESRGEDSVLLMDETLLAPFAQRILEQAPAYLQSDWFHLFPPSWQPSPLCLILGGVGARSDLHADPLAWTGWNCLLRGRKLWRFFPAGRSACDAEPRFGAVPRPFGVGRGELCAIGCGRGSAKDSFQEDLGPCLEYLQQPGETLIFPGHWWHQTYHLTTTEGFAGQLLNGQNLRRVMEHIVSWCHLEVEEEIWQRPHQEVIAQVLSEAVDSM
ncbi:unnamed protein product [Effrenium voratum]|nr:unnamed protein product [Effrenium voratum]